MTSTASPPRDSTTAATHRWLVLAVLLAAEVMDVLDTTAVTVAGPELKTELGASSTALQWVIGGYALAIGSGLVLGGRLGDRFGRRRVFLIGVAAFTLASALCALAPTPGVLIALRLLQGAAGALILPQSYGVIRAIFPAPELPKAFGAVGPVMSLSSVAGPVIGGALIQAQLFHTGWRLIFLINIPIGVAVFALGHRLIPRDPGDPAARVDLPGAAMLIASCALLVLPFVQAGQDGWPWWSWASLVLALLGFVLFARYQRFASRRARPFLVAPGIFRNRAFLIGTLGTLLFFACQVGTQLTLTLQLQIGSSYSAGQAGLAGIPFAAGVAIGAGLAGGLLIGRLGRATVWLGAGVQLLGTLALLLVTLTLGTHFWPLAPGLLIAGAGTGMVLATLFDLVVGTFTDAEVGSGSGVLSASQSVGAAAGVGVFGSVFFAWPAHAGDSAGFEAALLVCAVILAVFLGLSFLLPRSPESAPSA